MTRRNLVIVRHAKADRPSGVADVDRPLNERGHADAAAAGAWLAANGYVPDVVLCSPSRRTRQTWHDLAVAMAEKAPGTSPSVTYAREIYDGGAAHLLELVQRVDPQARTVMVIGHNPTISAFTADLDPGTTLDSDGLRTSGIAVHAVPGDWKRVAPGSAAITALHPPYGSR